MKSNILFIVALGTMTANTMAQPTQLKMEDDLTTILGDNANKVTKATVQTESEKTASIQIEFVGFKDKEYYIVGNLLNQIKKPIKEIETVRVDLDSRAGLADFFFNFKQVPGRNYPADFLETWYVEFSIIDKKGIGSIQGLENFGIGAKKYTFKYKKQWKLKGATGQEVSVRLVPYKSAATIKP